MKDWQKVEAVLFGSGKYLTEDQISELSGVPLNKLKKVLKEVVTHYEGMDSSLQIYHEMDTWKMNAKEEFTDIMRNVMSDAEMPKPIMETLAVIAYKAPVLQSEIIDARGSGAYDHIGLLEKKGFVEKQKHGRTYKLRLGGKFFDYFDIEGPAQVQGVFKEAKKPEELGDLKVYESDDSDEGFSEKITERLKQVETTEQDTKEGEDFLNDMDKKLDSSRKRIDEAEKELSEFKREETEKAISDEEEPTPEEILKKVNKDIDEIVEEKEDEEPEEEKSG